MELNIFVASTSYLDGSARMVSKNERVELEMKIMKYRALARAAPDKLSAERIETLVSELEQKLREIDE
jgi:uncharacterized protein (DUF2267 family)